LTSLASTPSSNTTGGPPQTVSIPSLALIQVVGASPHRLSISSGSTEPSCLNYLSSNFPLPLAALATIIEYFILQSGILSMSISISMPSSTSLPYTCYSSLRRAISSSSFLSSSSLFFFISSASLSLLFYLSSSSFLTLSLYSLAESSSLRYN